MEVVQVGGHLGLQLVLDQESVHAAVEELGSEAVVPRKIYKSYSFFVELASYYGFYQHYPLSFNQRRR